MEPLTKRILAIVLIAVIGVGVGVTVWIFVAPYGWSAEDCPGAPTDITGDQIIRMGVLGGTTDIQGKGALEGATLAAYEINDAGGIVVGGVTYYIGIVSEDTDEANPNLDITKGVAAAERIINFRQCQFLIGGFRTESLVAYLEPIMAAKIPFIGTGAATDSFCENVQDNYAKYKYWFRNMPINSSALGGEIFAFLLTYSSVYGVNKFGIIYEDLDWTTPLVTALKGGLPAYGKEIVAEIAYPITASQTEMDGYMATIDANNTQILIPLISAQGGILMMNSYDAAKPGFIIIGIDVQSQLDTFWADSEGHCLYETILQIIYRTNKTDKSIAFWDAYVAKYEHYPLYTAVGSYDAVYQFAWAIEESQSFSGDTIVTEMEKITTANPLPGAGGLGAFTTSHDLQEGYPYGYALFVQWQAGETKVVATSYNSVYPDSLAPGTYQLPKWPGWAFNT